ncbi:MAG: hypothetical protein A3H72_01835 [Candidatus Doudnabacteria bacterium RIFCSPLOWO2_02_FULL_48_8]|uniref:DUF1761 domain-containing protein n=1 Tax=Candidatus Doudnabacteria bacterium RIFCSPHIGHO2_01_FULL_46_24 TaxID=1817825 RepID=A0A1F5NTZ7_9BACT|nr:MAG: hypothetical protein A2720_01180 [Candidatus Doudnabacteria bacterium RIFCSPHIGHO2_01_FULL_46_24]OGE95197.1 MAG: hypothetical protein A3H72_01835 [Candidatus Doudnabacteria bacterium RIFCSPLOWO2_02_FULL_48_8]OGE96088.1 MAG: hypothetical protein A3E98_02480 [Candidatus Doudnabacteria bacterium RIFCSPHIGHO2_12_FULL_48_11]
MQAVPLNYWAVLVCGVVSIALGSLWYGPVFGKMWMRLMGWDKMNPEQMAEAKKGMIKSYALSFVGALVMAYVLAHALVFASSYMNVEGYAAGLSTGFWMWLGFVLPVTMSDVLWGQKSWKLWSLNSGYYLVQLLMFGVILALWG